MARGSTGSLSQRRSCALNPDPFGSMSKDDRPAVCVRPFSPSACVVSSTNGADCIPGPRPDQRTPSQIPYRRGGRSRETVTLRPVSRMRYCQASSPSRNSFQPVGISAPTTAADWLPRSIYKGCAATGSLPLVSPARSDRPRNRGRGSLRQATRTAPTCDQG